MSEACSGLQTNVPSGQNRAESTSTTFDGWFGRSTMAGTSSNYTPATSKHCLACMECLGGVAAAAGATDLTARAWDGGGDERLNLRIQPRQHLPFINPGTFSHKTIRIIDSSNNSMIPAISKPISKQIMRYVMFRLIVECPNSSRFRPRSSRTMMFGGFRGLHPLSPATTIEMVHNNQPAVIGKGSLVCGMEDQR